DCASYVVTDSFHGTCMSYIHKKPFSVYFNEQRGADRFVSLMEILGLQNRRIFPEDTEEKIIENKNVGFDIDWSTADKNVEMEKNKALNWLKKALGTKKTPSEQKSIPTFKFKELEKPLPPHPAQSNPDFIKIRLLVTLLRDYGIKHVVLSPGGRDVPIIRMFEYNESQFILHRVTDERSAAYYGLGLATQLHRPVACVCTSGTAASNFLPAVTEAFYTGIPLILITADRYEIYLNQGEDQTIPQKRIFEGVVKKEISVPEADGWRAEYQARREISDCILETTHNGNGPVHINIPVDNISVGADMPKEQWRLLPFIYPHILRAGFNDGESDMMRWVDALKKSQRILLVYGQNAPLTDEQKTYVELFASRYNCVIVTDFIANLNCKYSLKPYNMIASISQDEFNRELAPDILITVGGKRLMNDPLTFKIRGGPANIRHWQVAPDGKIKDFYFRLSSVIESSQDNFFKWFAKKGEGLSNNGVYYNKWKERVEKTVPSVSQYFGSQYIQSKFLPAIPPRSVLHLGVGQSFFDCRKFTIDPTVEVYCNMGTNGIDGCTSTFMGQCAVAEDKLCFLLVGDLSFFYDMNSIWNKPLTPNIRILLVNNNGSGLLRGHNLKAVTSVHNTVAEGWVKSTGFEYMSARSKEEFEQLLPKFLSEKADKAIFFEVICG
ncbi:MAG: 2-succinyl-5-enolpyruvyl-6-hydroxy-3-cyclohexene-1-carboxylic-acid synthase, partial [Eubacteriales bacterium]